MPLKKKKTTVKKVAKKTAKKTVVKKVPAKKVTKKKAPAKKPVAKKKAPAKKPVAKKKAPAKKTATKKAPAKKPVAKKTPTKKPAAKKPVAKKKAPAKKPATKKITTKQPAAKQQPTQKPIEKNKDEFSIDDFVIYPSHGIGKVINIETTNIMGTNFSCYLIYFEKEKLTIKVPKNNAKEVNLRHVVDKKTIEEVFSILRSGVKKMKGMWSRRAQEYEAKINSGDIFALAEVLRDLARDIDDGDRSYSERIIYETAIARLAAEYAAIYGIDPEEAKEIVTNTAKDKLNSDKDDSSSRKIRDLDDDDEDEYDDDDDDDDEDDDYDDDFDD